jgi:hypothetical protein
MTTAKNRAFLLGLLLNSIGPVMNDNLSGTLDRADELIADLKKEFESCLSAKEVSQRAVQITHDVMEKLRGVLDRAARRYWENHVRAALTQEDQDRATIYFPISDDQNAFDSVMGRWRWRTVATQHDPVRTFLLGCQPFSSADNKWLKIVNDLAVAGKHIDLLPQKKHETKRINVTSASGGSVSWDPSGVRFGGSGVRIAGAPIDPATQRIVPTPGVTETIETWVSFMIADHNVSAFPFCTTAVENTRKLLTEMDEQFDLS